jgi:hypothetical protein
VPAVPTAARGLLEERYKAADQSQGCRR